LADFALLSEDLESAVKSSRARGLEMAGPFEGSRRKPDGQKIAWRTAGTGSAGLPFLIEDLTPRELRVPSGSSCSHPNNAAGIAALQIACRDLERSASQYQLLSGHKQEIEAVPDGRPTRACFRFNGTDLILVPGEGKVAMRRSEAAIQNVVLLTATSSERLILRHIPSKGYALDPA
jgi:hypothetical protein